jgi:hypothetical protein
LLPGSLTLLGPHGPTALETWGATTGQILALRDFLEREHVTTVVMEATSDYWKPFFYLLEETLPVMLKSLGFNVTITAANAA